MNKAIIIFLTVTLTLNSYSQNSFEKGYYIDNANQKVEGLIKNRDWLNNPSKFKFKLSENSQQITLTIRSVKEFGILNKLKYIKQTVQIDRSSERLGEISNLKRARFNNEELFLKVLVEGKANLYLYEETGLVRYFFSVDNKSIEQLIYKSYLNSEHHVAKNNAFRQQLWRNLRCHSITLNQVEKAGYKRTDLIKLFQKFNDCNNATGINFEKKAKKKVFNLTLRPGVKNASLNLQGVQSLWKETKFENQTGYRFGIEAGFTLPFNNNKWNILLEPTYSYFKSKKTFVSNKTTGDKMIASVNYKSLEIPLTLRHYFFLNDKSKIFANTSFISEYNLNSSLELTRPTGYRIKLFDISTNIDFAFGIGYKFRDRYSLEFRYQFGKNLLSDYVSWRSELNSFSIIMGYSLF